MLQTRRLSSSLLLSSASIRSSTASNRTSLCTGLRSSVVFVLMTALLMSPLESGSTFTMMPIDQSFLGVFLSLINTTSSIFIFLFSWHHFGRCWSVDRYSFFHRDQNWLQRCWTLRQRRRMETSFR